MIGLKYKLRVKNADRLRTLPLSLFVGTAMIQIDLYAGSAIQLLRSPMFTFRLLVILLILLLDLEQVYGLFICPPENTIKGEGTHHEEYYYVYANANSINNTQVTSPIAIFMPETVLLDNGWRWTREEIEKVFQYFLCALLNDPKSKENIENKDLFIDCHSKLGYGTYGE